MEEDGQAVLAQREPGQTVQVELGIQIGHHHRRGGEVGDQASQPPENFSGHRQKQDGEGSGRK